MDQDPGPLNDWTSVSMQVRFVSGTAVEAVSSDAVLYPTQRLSRNACSMLKEAQGFFTC